MRPGEYVVLNASGNVDQFFGDRPVEYAQALMWAVSQAITSRSKCTLAFLDDSMNAVPLIVVSHPYVA